MDLDLCVHLLGEEVGVVPRSTTATFWGLWNLTSQPMACLCSTMAAPWSTRSRRPSPLAASLAHPQDSPSSPTL